MKTFIAILLIFLSISGALAASGVPAGASAPAASAIQCDRKDRLPHVLKLGEYATLQVPHEKYADFTSDNVPPTPVLYINDLAIKGLPWTYSGCERISFFLERTEESRDVWGKALLKLDGKSNVPVGIGTVQKGFVADIGEAKLVLTPGSLFPWYLGMIVLVAAVLMLGKSSGLLRDLPAPSADSAPQAADEKPCTDKGRRRPFSLARVQMAWWFVLSVGAYTYIWLKTGEISNTIPDSLLSLIGISSGTTVLSAVVDTTLSKRQEETSCGFVKDILSDSDSISFHRFQMIVWTIVLGFIFVKKVCATLIMPDFDAQLLGLMGISSGTYLGFKIPAASAAAQANTDGRK